MTDTHTPVDLPIVNEKDNLSAVQFLQRQAKDHVLCAIEPLAGSKFPISSKYFSSTDSEGIKHWITLLNGKKNLYFHVNTLIKQQNKKAFKKDMYSAEWLHIDLDMDYDAIKAGTATIESEQERILASLTNKLPKGVPAPTIVMFSGGGYQGFWKLTESFIVNGDVDKCKEFELYNKRLEKIFGADSCHDICRIMRIPSTINIPSEKKLSHGRVESKAELLIFNDNQYDLSEFKKFVEPQAVSENGTSEADENDLPYDGIIFEDLNELKNYINPGEVITPRTFMIIAKGNHDEYPLTGDASGRLYYIASLLQSQGVPQNILMRIFMDKEYGIARDHVFKNGVADKRAASRAITRSAAELKRTGDPGKKERLARTAEFEAKKGKKKGKKAKQPKHDVKGYPEDTPLRVIIADKVMEDNPEMRLIKYPKTMDVALHGEDTHYQQFRDDDMTRKIFAKIEDTVTIAKPSPLANDVMDTIKSRLDLAGRITYPDEWVNKKYMLFKGSNKALNFNYLRDRSQEMIIELNPNDYTFTTLDMTVEQFMDAKYEGSKWEAIQNSIFKGEPKKQKALEHLESQAVFLENEEQRTVNYYGQGGTGKTTRQEALQAALGKKNVGSATEESRGFCVTAPQSVFVKQSSGKDDMEGLACVRNARIVLTTETANSKMNTEVVKSLASGDVMMGRILYKGLVSINFTGLLILHGNTLPNIISADSGLTRRLKVIPFNHNQRIKGHEKKKHEMAEIFEEEKGIILRRMFDMAIDYVDNGSAIDGCPECNAMSNEYFQTEDSFDEELEMVIEPKEDGEASYNDIVAVMVDKFPNMHRHLTNRKLGGKLRDSATYGKFIRRLDKTPDRPRGTYLIGYSLLPYDFKDKSGAIMHSVGGTDPRPTPPPADENGNSDKHENGAPKQNELGENLDDKGNVTGF